MPYVYLVETAVRWTEVIVPHSTQQVATRPEAVSHELQARLAQCVGSGSPFKKKASGKIYTLIFGAEADAASAARRRFHLVLFCA